MVIDTVRLKKWLKDLFTLEQPLKYGQVITVNMIHAPNTKPCNRIYLFTDHSGLFVCVKKGYEKEWACGEYYVANSWDIIVESKIK